MNLNPSSCLPVAVRRLSGLPLLSAVLLGAAGVLRAADPVFSGPQPGERTTGFNVVIIGGEADGRERDPIAENGGAPTALVFVHQIERSIVPLLRVVEEYAVQRGDRIRTEFIFLTPDRLAGEQHVRNANGSLKLRARTGISPDGAEGPGNYGLNRDCLMTIVTARDNRVIANFALVQPGIADAPGVIAALARTCGDDHPPTVEALAAKRPGAGMSRARPAIASDADGGGGMPETAGSEPAKEEKKRENFPGAVPTDGKLVGLLREFIRPTNDDATVDRVLAEVKAYIRDNADLNRQAADGWTRVLHFGDRYGTPHAREAGQAFLDSIKSP